MPSGIRDKRKWPQHVIGGGGNWRGIELATLTNHGTMKLRSAVVRAMILSAKERKRATIVRDGKPAMLNFKQISNLGAKWDERRGSSTRGNRSQETTTKAKTHSISWE